MKNGFIITLSGISGAGKSHFIKQIINRCDSFDKLKAVTTRPKRKDEIEGVDKFFVTLDEFQNDNQNGNMCIVNNVFGNMYGYYKTDIDQTKNGKTLVTELYYKEVENFKKEYPNTISVYVVPSDINKTIGELSSRNTGYEELNKRLSDIKSEIDFFTNSKASQFDIIITNNYDLDSVDEFIRSVLFKINERLNESKYPSFGEVISDLDDKLKTIVDDFAKREDKKSVIYTSFDGDDMHFLHNICSYEINRGNVPLNPETALGYYVSTVSLGGKKKAVMKDCLTLELLADKMSVYSKKDRALSEGILAEMILWEKKKKKGLDIIEGVTQLYESPNLKFCTQQELEKFVKNQDDILKYEIEKNLLAEYCNEEHKSAYLIANMENFKHIDWARSYCYMHGLCPISPQNILPMYLYKGKEREYLEARLELLKRSSKIILFLDRNNLKEEFESLDQFSKAELYYATHYLKDKQIEIIGWDEALVPKYNQASKWSLTTKEDIQVRKMLK